LSQALVRLARSAALRRELAASAREHVITHHATERVVQQRCDLYRETRKPRRN